MSRNNSEDGGIIGTRGLTVNSTVTSNVFKFKGSHTQHHNSVARTPATVSNSSNKKQVANEAR